MGDDRFRVGRRARPLRPRLRRADARPGACSRRARPSTDKEPHSLHAYFVEAGTPERAARARGRPGARRSLDVDPAGDRHAGRADAPGRDRLVPRQPHEPRGRRSAARRPDARRAPAAAGLGCATCRRSCAGTPAAGSTSRRRSTCASARPPTFLGGPPRRRAPLALDAPAPRRRRRPAAAHRAARLRQRLLPARHGVPLLPGARSQPRAFTGFSLDHALWFHRPVRFDRWHLHTQETLAISGHRGLVRGAIHDADGHLVASVMQEVLRPTGQLR